MGTVHAPSLTRDVRQQLETVRGHHVLNPAPSPVRAWGLVHLRLPVSFGSGCHSGSVVGCHAGFWLGSGAADEGIPCLQGGLLAGHLGGQNSRLPVPLSWSSLSSPLAMSLFPGLFLHHPCPAHHPYTLPTCVAKLSYSREKGTEAPLRQQHPVGLLVGQGFCSGSLGFVCRLLTRSVHRHTHPHTPNPGLVPFGSSLDRW